MPSAFIALGSNIEPAVHIEKALLLLGERTRLLAISTVWRTAPLERPDQEDYYNCVAQIETDLSPEVLMSQILRRIEEELGRVRTTDKYAPRTIDLDLILYDDLISQQDELILPDPDIFTRPFLAAGLLELMPQLQLPGGRASISQVVLSQSREGMEPLQGYTKSLRGKVLHEPRQN